MQVKEVVITLSVLDFCLLYSLGVVVGLWSGLTIGRGKRRY